MNKIYADLLSFIKQVRQANQDIVIKYEYLENTDTHLVELVNEDQKNNADLWEIKYDFYSKIKKEYAQTIIFVDQSSLTQITNPDHEVALYQISGTTFEFDEDTEITKFDFSETEIPISNQELNTYALAA